MRGYHRLLRARSANGLRRTLHPSKGRGAINRAEIECAMLSKPCLDRRMPACDLLCQAGQAWADRRYGDHQTVQWTFS
jgi:hypothetical protein